ncbi:hypothetical protein V8E36_002238 [Tilletia maclaganii]
MRFGLILLTISAVFSHLQCITAAPVRREKLVNLGELMGFFGSGVFSGLLAGAIKGGHDRHRADRRTRDLGASEHIRVVSIVPGMITQILYSNLCCCCLLLLVFELPLKLVSEERLHERSLREAGERPSSEGSSSNRMELDESSVSGRCSSNHVLCRWLGGIHRCLRASNQTLNRPCDTDQPLIIMRALLCAASRKTTRKSLWTIG